MVCGFMCSSCQPYHSEWQSAMHVHIWLVVWLPFFIFPYIGNNHPNWLSYFSEGWPNHQPEYLSWVETLEATKKKMPSDATFFNQDWRGTPESKSSKPSWWVSCHLPPHYGWFNMENPIKMDDLGVPLFQETNKCCHRGAPPQFVNGSTWKTSTRLESVCPSGLITTENEWKSTKILMTHSSPGLSWIQCEWSVIGWSNEDVTFRETSESNFRICYARWGDGNNQSIKSDSYTHFSSLFNKDSHHGLDEHKYHVVICVLVLYSHHIATNISHYIPTRWLYTDISHCIPLHIYIYK